MTLNRWLLPALISALSTMTLGCNAVGLLAASPSPDAPPAITPATEATLAAMNATVAAINAQQTQPTATPQIIVVTATPSPTLPSSPTPSPTLTPLPPPTETPPPPAAQPAAAQSRTIVIIVTPTSPPTATPYPEAPIIVAPSEGQVVAAGGNELLHWSWNGLLGSDEFFEVKLRPDGSPRSAYIAQERGTAHDLRANLGSGRYLWTVQVVRGSFINDSGHPDDWQFEAFRSPESEPRLIIIDQPSHHDNDDHHRHSPPSPSHAEAPPANMPIGLLLGGLAFAVFTAGTYRLKK